MVKKIKVYWEGQIYTHSDFRTPACVRARTAVISIKGASMLDQITQATDIRSEKLKKRTHPKFFIGNQNSNTGDYGPKAHRVGLEAQQSPFLLFDSIKMCTME